MQVKKYKTNKGQKIYKTFNHGESHVSLKNKEFNKSVKHFSARPQSPSNSNASEIQEQRLQTLFLNI